MQILPDSPVRYVRVTVLDYLVSDDYNGSMDRFPSPLDFFTDRKTLAWLLVPVVILPIGITVLFLFARIFVLFSDAFSAWILDGTSLVLCILWCLSLVLILLCVVFRLLQEETEE